MEQRDKSMGAGASAKAEAVDVVRPARYGVDPDSSVRAERESRAEREARVEREARAERERDEKARERERERERDSKSERERDHKEAKEGREHHAEGRGKGKKSSTKKNRLRETRIEKMMSKAELARRANLSVLTIDRVEKGLGCRMDTKRKILEALGLSLADRVRVFGEEE
jgi:DNA-binding XRE family transcriptional regulator